MVEMPKWATGPIPGLNESRPWDGPLAHLGGSSEQDHLMGQWPILEAGLKGTGSWASGPPVWDICYGFPSFEGAS